MKKIGIFGYFAFGKNDVGGQPVKTNNLYDALLKVYNRDDIIVLDTMGITHKFTFFFRTISLIYKSENLIIMPAHNGIKHFPKFYIFIKNVFGLRNKIHYVVIGGWLHSILINNKKLLCELTKFDFIYVETSVMKENLNEIGLHNVHMMKNFKNLDPLFTSYDYTKGFVFCFYSRVIFEKGVESAIKAIYKANEYFGANICKLHILGPVSEDYLVYLNEIINHEVVQYIGVIGTNEAPKYLSKYFMQIFPTRCFTEGIPGSIIDSFFSGLPVISSRWESVHEVIIEKYNGITYAFDSSEELVEKVIWSVQNHEKVLEMRRNCIVSSNQYRPENALKILIENINLE